MRKAVAYIFLLIIFGVIVLLFWYNEWIYNLPTPIPKNYSMVERGAYIDLPAKLKFHNNKPLLLHFFNPDCPCSKFNIPHFRYLIKEYRNEINFAIVVVSNKKYSTKEITDKFDLDLDIPVLTDSTLPVLCGVYSSPQAVIIDTYQKLYFRGNYNKSRYCSDKKSNYAQIALDAILSKNNILQFTDASLRAYGCELPNCTKEK